MTLKEKYTIKNKKRAKQFIFLCAILVCFFVLYSSLAKFERISEGYAKVEIANWKMMLNGKELTNSDNTLSDSIKLIPTTNVDGANPNKIKPGQTGYFDIEINPTDTEVSFAYQLTLDTVHSSLPANFTIDSYSINGGTTTALPPSKIVDGTVSLGSNNIFTGTNKQIIRYFWNWIGEDSDITAYTVVVKVELKQVI